MTASGEKVVAIFGSSRPQPGDPAYEQAYAVGRAVGQAGYTIRNGGYGGTMEASARGAKDAGGTVVGITCTVFDRSGPNAYNDHVQQADNLYGRLEMLIDAADAFVVLPGGSGTLVELGMVWELVAKRLISPRPIILYGRFWERVIETASQDRPKTATLVQCANSPEQVLALLEQAHR